MQRNSCRRMMRLSWGHHGLFRRPCLQGPSESVQIRRKYLLYGIVNRSMWIMPQAELKDMEREFYTGIQRFDVRRAPSELRAATSPGIQSKGKLRQSLE
ncbi:uncharacterized protein N7446_010220 [Penicillium canescens]|uniref:Uncharacterized protein n=1 Tax=Penicillium canescens TaxID=5083 RepID=A0AAD6I849_PENCN|nr:uncharacterized protein N7446_010220 [Penicillium canescens]KAJ6035458.1 hypothetical protein N7460_009633 [Penicillium canescens]KAJ6037581.1 hypothetical protein N7444_010286 [Penicillium canescens]KAJ6054208.1 hypothetical protein N7446_010220 [Penicillium canescens]